MTNRSDLLRFHRRMFSELRLELEKYVGRFPSSLQKYYQEYREGFLNFVSLVPLSHLITRMSECHIVFCGDYHTLRRAQMTNLTLLRRMNAKRKIILATELVYSSQQAILDRYIAKEIDDSEFLEAVNYRKTFGFNWTNYRPIFRFAIDHKIQVIAIDHRADEHELSLAERDRLAGKIIAEASCNFPDHLIWAMIGDLHLAPPHLPAEVQNELSERGCDRRVLVVHQNSERLFWWMARKGLHGAKRIVRMNQNAYCILNTPPWMKLYSYVSWLENSGESFDDFQSGDEVIRAVRALSKFFRINEPSLPDFAVYTEEDHSFLKEFDPISQNCRRFRRKLERRKAFIVPSRRIIYLPDTNLDHAAELASLYIHAFCSKFRFRNSTSRDEFYRRVCHHALGFLGSKIMNDYQKAPSLSSSAKTSFRFTNRSVQLLGRLMGNRMYRDMLKDRIDIKELREFFYDDFSQEGRAEHLFTLFQPFSTGVVPQEALAR